MIRDDCEEGTLSWDWRTCRSSGKRGGDGGEILDRDPKWVQRWCSGKTKRKSVWQGWRGRGEGAKRVWEE